MGACHSSLTEEELAEMKKSKALDKKNAEDHKRDQEKIKLLLLGAGESGKSTIFKQMKILYGLGFPDEERKAMTPVVYNNTITSMKTLIENADLMGFDVAKEVQRVKEAFLDVSDEQPIDADVGDMIMTLWADDGLQRTFEQKSKFQLNDSADYYFNNVERIMQPDYVATKDDILRSRVRTSGIVEDKFRIDGVEFCMYDVGGQRNERKKWIHCFDNVTAVIFVAAISEYDQVLYEDNTQNRMEEAISLFDEICNSRWFTDTSIILFLNKRDLFELKIKRVDLRQPPSESFPEWLFEDYDHGTCTCGGGYPSSYECRCGVQSQAQDYLLEQFLMKNRNDEKEIYPYVTCATDTDNIKHVFNACKDIILKSNLRGSGFME
eukprot:PLAT4981.3.p2 GENE.PLAT4981.3~~PLAT4981.3.p2  ORF type:complete len:379 (-),score=209.25 PLAT4981.3:192-1328(-)